MGIQINSVAIKAFFDSKWVMVIVTALFVGSASNVDRMFSTKIIKQDEISVIQLEAKKHTHPEIMSRINNHENSKEFHY